MSLPQPENETIFPWDEEETALPATAPVALAPEPVHLPDPDLEVTQPVLTSQAQEEKLPDQMPADLEQTPVDLAQTMPVQAAVSDRPFLKLDEPPLNELEDTKPRGLTHAGRLEPVSPAFSQLSYTCVLIPRLPQHHLTGVLSEKLGQWVQQFCLAFGWRLEGIAIRPEYLQWTVQVSPSIAPGNLMRILRQRVSDSIFESFPVLAQQNPSDDFWATGYLIVGGPQPPSPRLLRDYIAETRRRQGVTHSGGDLLTLPVENQARLPKA
jgi:REP element-mobilizing transposase RayT